MVSKIKIEAAKLRFLAQINSLAKDDNESAHACADEALLEFLAEAGHADLVQAYKDARDKIGFWYA